MKISMVSFGPVETKSNGYCIRCYNVAISLIKQGHKVVVLEFPDKKPSNLIKSEEKTRFVHLSGNEIICKRISLRLKKVLSFDPFHSIKFQFCSLAQLIRYAGYLRDTDFVLVEGALIPFGIIIPKVFRKKVILDTHGVNKLLALHFKDRNRAIYFARKILWDILERFATKLSDVVVVVSKQEKEFIQTEYKVPKSKVFLVPNVIELQRKGCSREELDFVKKEWNLDNKIIVVFVGDLDMIQNKDAVEYIYNELALSFFQKRSDVAFVVIGSGAQRFKNELPNLVFTGFVTDLTPFLEMSDVCIAPLRVGCGVKTKVLQYLAYGKPIVTTPIGIEGIDITKTKATIVANIANFEKVLLKAILDLDQLRNAAKHNEEIFQQKYSLQSLGMSLEQCVSYATKI